jgi:hypothetical protein
LNNNERKANVSHPAEEIVREQRALAILRLLQRQPGYTSNERVLGVYLDSLGLMTSRANLRQTMEALETSGFLRIEKVDALMVLSLTDSGDDVATGREIVDGIARPEPDCPY